MQTKLTRAALAALLAATTAAPALAQAGAVLTIDLERIYSDSAAAKSAQQQLQARYTTPSQQANTAFTTARTAYETQVQAAQKVVGPSGDASKLPPATRQSLGEAQERLEDARNNVLQVNQAVQSSAAYVRDQLNQQVLPIAEQVRAERKAAAVLVRGTLLAADPATDITSVVLPRLDAAVKTVNIVPPQQAPAAGAAPAATTPPVATTPARPQPRGR